MELSNLIFAIIAASVGAIVLAIEVWRFAHERIDRRISTSAKAEYERKKDILFRVENPSNCIFNLDLSPPANLGHHQFNITLQMALDTYVDFVAVQFQPEEGDVPHIIDLFDPRRTETGGVPSFITIDHTDDGTWYYNCPNGWHRQEGSRVTIGIKFSVQQPSSGKLFVKMTARNNAKDRILRYRVKPSIPDTQDVQPVVVESGCPETNKDCSDSHNAILIRQGTYQGA